MISHSLLLTANLSLCLSHCFPSKTQVFSQLATKQTRQLCVSLRFSFPFCGFKCIRLSPLLYVMSGQLVFTLHYHYQDTTLLAFSLSLPLSYAMRVQLVFSFSLPLLYTLRALVFSFLFCN